MFESLSAPPSYKERLLRPVGDKVHEEEWLEDMEMPEDKWYKDVEDEVPPNQGDLDPCPIIPVTRKEYESQCQDWKKSLIVTVLGKRVGFKILARE